MSLDTLIPLLTSSIVMILVGIFLAPVIKDLTSKRERQESHTDLDDLIRQRERWLQMGDHLPKIPLEKWRQSYADQTKSLESFLTWGDPEFLDQLNSELETPMTAGELRLLLRHDPPSIEEAPSLDAAIRLLVKKNPPE